MFVTEGDAKRFFVTKAVQQAQLEGSRLSDAERRMLSWSESDPELQMSAEEARALIGELALEMSDEEYEAKVAALLKNAYENDLRVNAALRHVWREAYAKLNEGDHYVAVMLDRALGRTLRRGWFSWL